jgi:hypothetical protein
LLADARVNSSRTIDAPPVFAEPLADGHEPVGCSGVSAGASLRSSS